MPLHRSWLVIVFAAVVGCSDSTQPCIALPALPPIAYQPAIIVGVSDSVTGKPVADSATGKISSLVSSDSLRHGWSPADSILIGDLGPGTFTVTVLRPGYLPWVRYGVHVAAGNCNSAVTTNLTARLKPAP